MQGFQAETANHRPGWYLLPCSEGSFDSNTSFDTRGSWPPKTCRPKQLADVQASQHSNLPDSTSLRGAGDAGGLGTAAASGAPARPAASARGCSAACFPYSCSRAGTAGHCRSASRQHGGGIGAGRGTAEARVRALPLLSGRVRPLPKPKLQATASGRQQQPAAATAAMR